MAVTAYWIGQDGNVWYKSSSGTQNAGKLIKDYGTGFDAQYLSAESTRIDDPNPGGAKKTTTSSGGGRRTSGGGGGGGGASSQKVLNDAAVGATQQAINSLDTEFNVGNQNIDEGYGSLISKYDLERGNTREDYDENVVTNNQNLQRNKQNALSSAAQGLRGLRGVLGSIGALSGDGSKLANQAVTTEANKDLGGATETAATNAQSFDKAWGRFDEEDAQRRKEAETSRTNQRTALEGSIASKRQNYFQKMAELYGDAGNTAAATDWLGKAGGLNNEIASKTRVAATPYSSKAAAYTPGDIESYLAGAGDMTVKVTDGGVAAGPTALNANSGKETEEQRRKRLVATA